MNFPWMLKKKIKNFLRNQVIVCLMGLKGALSNTLKLFFCKWISWFLKRFHVKWARTDFFKNHWSGTQLYLWIWSPLYLKVREDKRDREAGAGGQTSFLIGYSCGWLTMAVNKLANKCNLSGEIGWPASNQYTTSFN